MTGDQYAFQQWLRDRNNGGQAFHYASAKCWLDERATNRSSIKLVSPEARAMAVDAYRAYQDGKLILVQRRDEGRIAYLAVKRHSPVPPSKPCIAGARSNSTYARPAECGPAGLP